MRKAYLLFGVCLAVPGLSFADNLQITGYVDSSYNYLEQRNQFTSGINNRVFDIEPNGFTLQEVGVTLADQPTQGFGGLLNLIGGRDASTLASYGFNPTYQFNSQTLAIDLTQLFIQYASGAFTTVVGKYDALAGYEQNNPALNDNFSRGILSGYAIPGELLGAKEIYAVNNTWTLTAGINNGWDNVRDLDRHKTLELSVAYTPNPIFSFSVQGYNGEERSTPFTAYGSTGFRSLIDAIAILNATKQLSFVADYDYGIQTNAPLLNGDTGIAIWTGIAGYVNYKFNDHWRISVRGEDFSDRNGYRTGVIQNWKEGTFTLGYSPIKDLEFRAETRHDFSNVHSFVAADGVSVRNDQQSYALEGVYSF